MEENVFRLVNDLPKALSPVLVGVMQLGSFVAVVVAVVATLALRRPLLARDLGAAGAAAWALARVAKDVVERGRPEAYVERVLTHGEATNGFGFPSGHVAVAAAMATAAGPWLPRRARRVAWAAVALVAVARVYVGAHLPLDVVGGAALGWALGAALHLLWGAPGGRPSLEQVRAALERAGLALADVRPASVDARGSTPFFATTADGRELFAKVVGREQRDADALFKGWRFLAFRELEDEEPFASPKRQVEHEAYLALLAERAGVRTPAIVAATDAGSGSVLLVQERIPGSTLDRVPADDVDDAWLEALWGQVAVLRRARIAHRDLRQANVLLDSEKTPWLIDFGFAEAAASDHRLAQDVAELLASLSCLVGAERAVASATKVLGTDAVSAALPLVQPLALSTATRHGLKAHHGLLGEVRQRGAEATGADVPPLERLSRIKAKNVGLLLVALVGIHLLLPQVGELGQTLDAVRTARWEWLVVGLFLSGVTYLMAGVGLMGAVGPRLALGRTAAVQLASSFANRITPGNLGGMGVNLRFLERAGVDRPSAVGAIALNSVAGAIVHAVSMVVAFALVGQSGVGRVVRLPRGWPVLVAVVAVLALLGVALFTPLGRRRLVGPALRALRNLGAVLRRPEKALQLFGGSFGLTAAYALALAASLEAFGARVPLVEVVAVYLGGAAVASVAPTPGGLGAMEAALVAGLTAFGAPHGPAIAGVLSFRLLTFWLPVLPGWVLYRVLRRRDAI